MSLLLLLQSAGGTPSTTAVAVLASASGSAGAGSVSIQPAGAAASATGTANNAAAAVAITAAAVASSATATALGASGAIQPTGAEASATGAAYTATVSTSATAPVWTTPADTVAISTTPTLAFTIPAVGSPMHFQMQLDQANSFDTGLLRTYDSSTDQTNWEYWDGGAWQTLPAGGVDDAYAGNEARYTVSSALDSGTWYTRVRAGI